MARKRRQEENSGGGEAWLATYADLVTLLLCFFVLLFASSTLDVAKFEAFISSFQGGAGVMPGGDKMDNLPSLSGDSDDETDSELEDLTTIKELIDEYSEEKGIEADIETVIEERGLLIRSLDNVFFDSGKAEVKQEAKSMLDFIGELIKKEEFSERQLRIEGHTDSDPITNISNKYPTNWELSAIRATNVLRYLTEAQGIDGNRVSTSGYGDTRPIVPNDTPTNKAINRRVDLIILRTSYSDVEPENKVENEQ